MREPENAPTLHRLMAEGAVKAWDQIRRQKNAKLKLVLLDKIKGNLYTIILLDEVFVIIIQNNQGCRLRAVFLFFF